MTRQGLRWHDIFRFWQSAARLRRAISRQGMPSQATNRFGRVVDFTLLEAAVRTISRWLGALCGNVNQLNSCGN